MDEITLQALLEAGCHFGHKSERWNPRAREFIYTEKDGIHIIDLAKTKAGLEEAATFVKETVTGGGEILFIATKRQAQGVVKEAAQSAGAPYFVERWIGGFLTNWDSIKKNIERINRLTDEQEKGVWKKYPKHERTKLARYLARLKIFYGGVLGVTGIPAALFVIDIRKEVAAVREARRRGIPIIGIVDTNSDPVGIDYVIPANDDAVGSIQLITKVIAQGYQEGKEAREKEIQKQERQKQESQEQVSQESTVHSTKRKKEEVAAHTKENAGTIEKAAEKPAGEPEKKKRRRPKKKSDQSDQ